MLAATIIKYKISAEVTGFYDITLRPSCFQQISYQSIESSDPGINVPGPRRTVSKLKNETYHMFSNLHPGTTYLISVRARTVKGFGQTALTEITTNISGISTTYWLSMCACEGVWKQL